MRERQVNGINPNEFGNSFLKGEFSNIYQQTSEQLRFLNVSKCVVSKVIALGDM